MLLRLPTGLRRFLRWSAEQAAAARLRPPSISSSWRSPATPIRAGPTVGDVAKCLFLRHHSSLQIWPQTSRSSLRGARTGQARDAAAAAAVSDQAPTATQKAMRATSSSGCKPIVTATCRVATLYIPSGNTPAHHRVW
jgi:hypothetical protein